MKDKLKKLSRKIKKWSTRKTTLWYAIIGMTLYMIVGTLYTSMSGGNTLDSTITTEWFSAMRWVCGLGGSITIADLVKTKLPQSNSNDNEKGEE